jgi:NADH-quinone oxidoreductase subunit M
MMITISIGFGIFPMHLYEVVRSGVDPLIARITHVVPVAESDGVLRRVKDAAAITNPPAIPMVSTTPITHVSEAPRGGQE